MEQQVRITRESRYKFTLDFGAGLAGTSDEPPPLGEGTGPSPTQMLAAAMANCLAASFVFACNKFKEDPGPVTATARWELGRNEAGRLRVTHVDVEMTLGVAAGTLAHLPRVLAQFEEFCTVSQSVRQGIPFSLGIKTQDGTVLKAAHT